MDEGRTAVSEPAEGWEGGQRLYDSELLTVVLCRYTGARIEDGRCTAAERHPATFCPALYLQAEATRGDVVSFLDTYFDQQVPEELRASRFGDEPTGR